MTWAWIARAFGSLFGFMLKNWRATIIIGAIVLISGLWRHSAGQADTIEELKRDITLLKTVVIEYENAQKELDGKVAYEKNNGSIASDSAAAVAAGRINGDGDMAPVLRAEYERVQRLSKQRAATHSR